MKPLSLLELNHIIRDTLDSELPPAYWVVAEIGELRLNQRGHCYLELIEKQDDRLLAKTRATIWAYSWRTLNSLFQQVTGQPLAPGMQVLSQVTVQYHELYGLSLNIRNIDPNFTLGESARKRQEIIEQLRTDGIFDMNRQLALPLAPQRIAVISSPTAAGWGDFLDQLLLNRFRYRFDVQLFRASMQGEEAESSILSALHKIYESHEEYDLLVLIRGGGAKADLDCFDRYNLAAHLAQFPLPVLTGIGHERDESICDLVAHTGLKTPTAVAEFLISGLRSFEEQVHQLTEEIVGQAQFRLQEEKYRLSSLQQSLQHRSSVIMGGEQQQIRHLGQRIRQASQTSLNRADRQLQQLVRVLPAAIKNSLRTQKNYLHLLEKELHLTDPQQVLARGYSIARFKGKPIHYSLPPNGASIEIDTAAGRLKSTITERHEKSE